MEQTNQKTCSQKQTEERTARKTGFPSNSQLCGVHSKSRAGHGAMVRTDLWEACWLGSPRLLSSLGTQSCWDGVCFWGKGPRAILSQKAR